MTTTKELKVPLSCRIHPELKEDLELEAYHEGVTTSAYVVSILERRGETTVIGEPIEDMEHLRARIQELEKDNQRLDKLVDEFASDADDFKQQLEETQKEHEQTIEQLNTEITALNEENVNLQAALSKEDEAIATEPSEIEYEEDVPSLRFDFGEVKYVLYQEYIDDLGTHYPHLNEEELVLTSLHAARANEKSSFFIHTIKGAHKSITKKVNT